ncbi:serine hydrolase [uncultured Jannaschia sp.]|uniref:serine hydrolase domain-containing protein n=1 Tax=uncultured Jannaschia sp. TaxID=293347 RepID=UPI00260519FB|nr:serine hydrolase [uncultured Jannaschia sp.]
MKRRAALTLIGAAMAAPSVLRAQGFDAVRDAAARYGQLHSLIVYRDGEERIAEAFRGPGLDQITNVKSASKTILSLLVGIAVDRGTLTTDDRLLPLLGRGPTNDARDDITIGDLLSLRAGLGSTSGPNYGAWVSSGNWVRFALDRPLEGEPGGRFIYSTGTTHLLGVALSRAAGRDLLGLARDWLGAPLGIDFAPWVADPQGNYLGGNDMGVTPRGLARIGRMCLAGGTWNGTQVVSEDWLDRAWTPRARSPFSGDLYGYGWFLTEFAGTPAAYARGYGGQVLAVLPKQETVIAITSDPNRPARSGGYFGDLRDLMVEIAAT